MTLAAKVDDTARTVHPNEANGVDVKELVK